MDKQAVINALRNTAQSASNTIAEGVSSPVDLIASGLRKVGLPIPSNALGGSEWMAQQGLTQPVPEGIAKTVGETAGLVVPAVGFAKPAQIAAALRQGGENLMTPAKLNKEVGGVLLKPLDGPHYGTSSLAEYSPKIYRETDISGLSSFGPRSKSSPIDLWFSNDPTTALGQGANRGVMMELDAANVPGQLSLKKPMASKAYESGYAEFLTKAIDPTELGKNIASVTISKDQQKGPYFRRALAELKELGLSPESMPDGSIKFSK